MSLTNSQITAASTPLFLGETEYLASPLEDKDFSELDEWLKSRYIRFARKSAPSGMDPESVQERDEITQSALKLCVSVSFFTEQGQALINTIDGVTHLTWLMLRKKQPTITEEQLKPFFTDATNIENTRIVFQNLHDSAFGSKEGKKEGE